MMGARKGGLGLGRDRHQSHASTSFMRSKLLICFSISFLAFPPRRRTDRVFSA